MFWGRFGGVCSEILVWKIIYIDCDCFYVVFEMCDDFSLCGKVLVVGGLLDKCGVVVICSYEV